MARVKKIVYNNLEAEIVRARLARAELAAMLGISRATMTSKLSGRTDFTLSEMRAIRLKLEAITGEVYTLDKLFFKEG